ncbi:hypothetical protein R3X25_01575 [Lutibacter sp. TH_r2]|uniref:hypothetical protein n=1 Tax=Lutibacter sp. TH_r2 TaxID=3082083 RepID=UPI002953AEC0|nr:hypothetical protein [Lutibacter sp. TH_r2]MDV7185955.1 hypothetical protein [Lutibacter sp. TH_r2]
MSKINYLKSTLSILVIVIFSCKMLAQDVDKVMFIKSVPVVMKTQSSFQFKIGYVATEDRDISVEMNGGPEKFWGSRTIKVSKGQGIKDIVLSPPNMPAVGSGYRLILSIKPRGGDWKTTIAARVINNLEFVKNDLRFVDDASFSLATPTVLESASVYNFELDYNVSKEHFVQVSIWSGKGWLATSKKIKVNPGKGSTKVAIPIEPLEEGNKYKFVLTFGTQDDFDNKTYAQKEMSGIIIVKATKKLTIKEINEKSIQISLNKESEILTLPGDPIYDSIRIIAMNGQPLLEVANSNSINISQLPQGAYFAITNTNDYYKFVKF